MNPADCHTTVRYAGEDAIGFLMEALWGFKVSGRENVPPAGPLILAGNHRSLLDGNVLGWAARPTRRPYFLGKAELFRNPFTNWLLRGAGCIPIDRRGDVGAMRAAMTVLERGGALVMFPEGGRVKPGETKPPKAGIGVLAAATAAPVLPARLLGMDEFPYGPFPIEVRLGRPLPPPPPGREAAQAFAQAVMDAVYAL